MGIIYNVGICDDERDTCARIADMVYAYGRKISIEKDLEIIIKVSTWYTGEELYADLAENKPVDLLFLDIELVSTDGIRVGKLIRNELENSDISIAYISSKSSYALELFKIHPVDFLIKPISARDINETMDEALRIYMRLYKNRGSSAFEYRSGGYNCRIPYKNIIYFSSENKKINMVTRDSAVQFTGRIKDIAEIMPEGFIQIHQSYIINMDYISECSYENVKMNGGIELSISQPYRKAVRKAMMDYEWGRDD